jgi:hypothetical protein
MAQPVWVLSVDLQAKTATFQTGMSDAARSARGAFQEIGTGAEGMGRRTGHGMMEARHSVMMLGEQFGVHIPRALAGFIASLGPIGAAMEAAFPFLAIAAGATILIEFLSKMHEAGEKLTDDQIKFGTASQNAFNTLDDKLLQAGIHADELRNDHLGALKGQLELIDHQSLAELTHAFEDVSKAADTVMKDLEGHWYTVGKGSAGATHALTDFKAEYDALLSQGKGEEASGLLRGSLDQAKKVLELQKTAQANDGGLFKTPGANADLGAALRAENELKQFAVGFTEKEVKAQEALVKALNDQVTVEGKVAALKGKDQGNAETQAGNEASARRAASAKQAADSMSRMGEQSLQADKAVAEAGLEMSRATLQARLSVELDFAGRERDLQLATNAANITALDKTGKDYLNQLKTLQDKALEIQNDYDSKITEAKAKSSLAVYQRDLDNFQAAEREKIEATERGAGQRLAAIDAALNDTEARNLQDTAFYKDLLVQRVQTVRQMTDDENKLKQDAAREEADNMVRMGELSIAAEQQTQALRDSSRNVTDEQRKAEAIQFANEEYQLKMAAMERELSGLDKTGKDYENKLKQVQDRERQLIRAHEQEVTAIKEKAEMERNQRVLSSWQQFSSQMAQGLTS